MAILLVTPILIWFLFVAIYYDLRGKGFASECEKHVRKELQKTVDKAYKQAGKVVK